MWCQFFQKYHVKPNITKNYLVDHRSFLYWCFSVLSEFSKMNRWSKNNLGCVDFFQFPCSIVGVTKCLGWLLSLVFTSLSAGVRPPLVGIAFLPKVSLRHAFVPTLLSALPVLVCFPYPSLHQVAGSSDTSTPSALICPHTTQVQGWHSGLPSCTSALCTPVAPATFSLLMKPELLSKQEASFSLHFCRISSPECPNPREMIFLRIPVISVISIELCVSYLHLTPESIPSSL